MAAYLHGNYDMSVKITDLGPIDLPLIGTEQLEIVDVNGESRRVSSSDLSSNVALQATFLTLTANVDLPNERILTAGVGIALVDGGAGGALTISSSAGQVDSIAGGTNVNVNAADPVNPIVNLDAALVGVSVNGVTLSDAGAATSFLDETGSYSVPIGSGAAGTVTGSTLRYDGAQFVESLFLQTDDDEIITITNSFSDVYTVAFGVGGPNVIRWAGHNEFDIGDASLSIGNTSNASRININYSGNFAHLTAGVGATLRFGSPTAALNLQLMEGAIFLFEPATGNDSASIHNDNDFLVFTFDSDLEGMRLENAASIYFEERVAASVDVANYGQFWVRNDVPNVPMFTDDAGNDFVLNAAGGAQISGVPANNQLAVWVSATDVEGESELVYNDGVLELTYAGVGTSINLDANNGNAIITLDGDESGFGSVGLRLTSSDVGNGSVLFNLNANPGIFSIEQRNTSGTVLEDTWISMSRNGAVTFFFNGVLSLRTSNIATSDVGMGAEVLSGGNVFEPVGMNVLPVNVQNAAFVVGVGSIGDMIIHDEVTARVYSLNNISGTKAGSMWSVINDAGSGTLTFQAGAGVVITFWNGSSWTTTAVAGSVAAGEGQFTVWKRTDTEYYLTGPNLV